MGSRESSLDAEARRRLMARFKGKDTKPEMLVRRALHRLGFRFRLHRRDLPGSPDVVLPGRRTALFVHGCFWHQHEGCRTARVPATRPEFWTAKLQRNKERDASNLADLMELGWRALVVWECEARAADLDERLLRLF